MDPTYPVQVALVARIKALATDAGGRVHDSVPADTAFPYVTVGPFVTVPIDETCTDGSEITATVNVWSREPGLPECEQIAGAIRVALHDGGLAIEGHVLDRMRIDGTDFFRDDDGITSRARIELTIFTQPA